MKYNKLLKSEALELPIVSDSITLDLYAPGRAIIAVQSEAQVSGKVAIYLGINANSSKYCTGCVTQCIRIDNKQMRLSIRELAAVLQGRFCLSMRNVNLKDVLNYLANASGVSFRLQNQELGNKSSAYFINIGSGYEALDNIGQAFGIDDYRWQSLPDGSVYIGSKSGLGNTRNVVRLSSKLFTETSASGASCPLLPALRPGTRIRIDDGKVLEITSTNVTGEKMRLNWSP